VLIVDDDAEDASLLKRMLEQEGYEVAIAGSGERALELYQTTHPDVIILDAVLPDLSGFEVCKALRALSGWADPPIMMVTSLEEDREFIERAFLAGVADYLTKPVQTQWTIFRRRIRRMIEAHRAEVELERERNLLRTLIDNLPDTIYIKDTQSRFLN